MGATEDAGFAALSVLPRLKASFRKGLLTAMRLFLPDLDDAVLWPRHGTFHEEEIPLGMDLVDDQANLRNPLTAQAARHAHPFEDTRGRGRSAHRARLAHVVRAVRFWAAVKAVALDRACKPLADRDPRHLHRV